MKAPEVSFLSIDEWKYLKFRNRMAGFFSSFKEVNRVQTSRLINFDLMLYS